MKFRFCGGLDAPDFLLREFATVSKISSIKVKLLCQQIAGQISEDGVNYEKIEKFAGNIGEDEASSLSELKGIVSALHFVLFNAAKNDTDDVSLSSELQQLGLPREHAETIGKIFREKKTHLQQKLREKSLHLPRIVSTEYRVDYVVGSSVLRDANVPIVRLKFSFNDGGQETMELEENKFNVLLYELQQARDVLEASKGV